MDSIASFEELEGGLEEETTQSKSKPIDPNSPLEIETVEAQAYLLDEDPQVISETRANQDFTHEGLAKQYPDLTRYLDTLYEAGVSVEEAGRLAREHVERKAIAVAPQEFIFSSMLMVDDETVNPESLRVLTNYEKISKRISERLEANDPSTFKWLTAGTFNAVRDLTLGSLEMLVRDDETRSKRYADSLFMEEDEFNAFWDKEIADAEARGVFNIREYETLNDLQALVDNFGTDTDAGFNQLLALVDIATLGGTKVVGRLASAGVKKAATGTRSVVSDLLASKTVSEAVTATKGIAEGGKATVKQLNSARPSPAVAYKAGPSTMDPKPSVNTPSAAVVTEGTKRSMLFEKMAEMLSSPFAGKTFTTKSLADATAEVADRLVAQSTNAFVKVSRRRAEGSDNYIYTALLGKADTGKPFTTKAAAMKAVKDDPRYKAVRLNSDRTKAFGVDEDKRGWYLEYSERVDTSRLATEIEDVNVEEGFLKRSAASLFSAGQTALGPRLGFMLNAAEGLVARVSKEADVAFKDISKLSKGESEELNKVITSYRDSPLGDTELDLAAQRGAPSSAKFEQDFMAVNGRVPSEQQMKAYRALVDFNNSSWNVKATEILKKVTERGGWTVDVSEGYTTIGVPVTVADDAVVFSRLQGSVRGSAVGDRIVYKLDEPFEDANGNFFEYVTDVADARVPQKSDVLGYNFGGSRNNETTNFFVGTLFDVEFVGGKKGKGGFRSLLGSYSSKEATSAARELNNIQEAIGGFLKATGLKSISKLELSGEDLDRVNDIISRNNKWNPSVENFDDLKDLSQRHKESFANKFEVKRRDQQVDTEITDGYGLSVGDYQSRRVARKRGDAPLMEYGGGRVSNQDPITNILEQFQSTAYRYTHSKATQAAVNGWVDKARRMGNVTFDGPVPSDPNDFLRRAKIKGSEGVDADMAEQQAVIKRRMGLEERTDKENNFFVRMGQHIYDEGVFMGYGKGLKTNPEEWLDGAAGRLRAMSFHLKMGFANPDQMVLNASHVAQIMAISPKAGAKATAAVPIIAQLMRKTAKAAAKDIDALYANGFAGMSKEELLATVKYMRESGRDIVGTSVLERSGTAFDPKKNAASELLELGLTPYKMGELFGRIASVATAVVEHNAKKISDDVFSEAGLQYVANREQVLSFRMTSGQKGSYQEGAIMGLATQWMSYTNRFIDNILIGRDLTKAERARMVGVNTVLFGTRGMGFSPKMTAALVAFGVDPEDENSTATLNAVKFGLFDLMLSQLVGEDVSLGSRIAPMGGIVQQYSELFGEDPLYATLGGPSAQIGVDTYKAIKATLQTLSGGHKQVAAEEFKVLMRNVKSVDIYSKVVELIETGEYRSKRRGLAGEFDEVGTGLVASIIGGATPMKVLNHYDAKDISYKEDAKFKDARSRIDTWATKALDLISTGEPAKMKEGRELYNDVMNLIEDGGFSEENQHKLYRAVVNLETMTDLVKRSTGQSQASQLTAKASQGE